MFTCLIFQNKYLVCISSEHFYLSSTVYYTGDWTEKQYCPLEYVDVRIACSFGTVLDPVECYTSLSPVHL